MNKNVTTINRKYLIKIFTDQLKLKTKEATMILEGILDQLAQSLKESGELKITNFGTFNINEHEERVGYNPYTQSKTIVQAHKTATFHASTKINDQLKAKTDMIDMEDEYNNFW